MLDRSFLESAIVEMSICDSLSSVIMNTVAVAIIIMNEITHMNMIVQMKYNI